MPAVLRPALRSVTRRTLKSVLARERSISFCKLRTLLRSPAFDAVKIRCRRRRTSLLTGPPVNRAQSRSRPLVRSPRRCRGVQLVLRFGCRRSSSSSQAHLTTSAPFRVRARCPYPASYAGRPAEGPAIMLPVSCRLSAAGVRFLVILFPLGDWAFLAVGLPGRHARTPTGLPRSTRMRCGRGGCPLYPGDGGAHTAGMMSPAAACRFAAASPYTPLQHPIAGARDNEASTRVHAIHPSGLPLACGPRMEREPLGFSPSFTPRRYQQRMSGWGQAIEH